MENYLSVEPFDPSALALKLSDEVVAELLAAAGELESPDFGLARDRIMALAVIARHDGACDWAAAAAPLTTDQLIALAKLFTVGEALPGWEAGARSPVIPLVAELKTRGEFPADLKTWIKSRTGNRFLPYGSLMDRL